MPEHPNNFKECVSKDVYERDKEEINKCLERIDKKIDEKRTETQKEIDYKHNILRFLMTGGLTVSLGISTYLFMQIDEVKKIITEHIQILGHPAVEKNVNSLMCKIFSVFC